MQPSTTSLSAFRKLRAQVGTYLMSIQSFSKTCCSSHSFFNSFPASFCKKRILFSILVFPSLRASLNQRPTRTYVGYTIRARLSRKNQRVPPLRSVSTVPQPWRPWRLCKTHGGCRSEEPKATRNLASGVPSRRDSSLHSE